MFEVLPLFKSHYSIGKSILTLGSAGSSEETGPDSIIDICSAAKLDHFYLVDDSMTGFMEAYHNASDAGIDLRFGLRLSICNDISLKEKNSNLFEYKCILFCKNKAAVFHLDAGKILYA